MLNCDRNTKLNFLKVLTSPTADLTRTVGTETTVRRSVLANPSVYCPRFSKQSSVKWFAQTAIFLPIVAGTWPSKMKSSHAALLFSSVRRKWKDLCCSLQLFTANNATLHV